MLAIGQTITDAHGHEWELVAMSKDDGNRPAAGDFLQLKPNMIGDFAKFALYPIPLQWPPAKPAPEFEPIGYLIFKRIR